MTKLGTNSAAEIIQVTDSIPWVRCASGNVLSVAATFHFQGNRQKNEKALLFLNEVNISKDMFSNFCISIDFDCFLPEPLTSDVFSFYIPDNFLNSEELKSFLEQDLGN